MDPVSMMLASTAFSGVTGLMQASAEGKAEKQRAAIEGQWNERRALEERASAQSEARNAKLEAAYAQSRLGSMAAASGSGASDPTIMGLWRGIGQEGAANAGVAMAQGQQRAAGLDYQTSLDRWTASTNARMKNAAARTTLIGSLMKGAGDGMEMRSRMAAKYGTGRSYAGTGYAR